MDYAIKIPSVTEQTYQGTPKEVLKPRIAAKLKGAAWVGPGAQSDLIEFI